MALQEALMIRAILVLSVLTAVSVTLGQPFSPAAAGTLHPGLTEARQREAVNYTGFIFDFDTASVSICSIGHCSSCPIGLRPVTALATHIVAQRFQVGVKGETS